MKKVKTELPTQTIDVFHYHRTRYQNQQKQVPAGVLKRCERCNLLLGARQDLTWVIRRNDLWIEVELPCPKLNVGCPACGHKNMLVKPLEESASNSVLLLELQKIKRLLLNALGLAAPG